MKAMLFAAGMGTRLKPLTDIMPKAMVPIQGKPLLNHTLNRLCEFGADEVVVNVHHFASQIIDYLNEHSFDCKVLVSDESESLLDTGGGLKKAAKLFGTEGDPILIHNVDILSNADLKSFYDRNRTVPAALLVSQRKSTRNLLFNAQNELVGWTRLDTGEIRSPYKDLDVTACQLYAFSGIHVFSPSLFPLMENFPLKFSIIDFYLSVCDKVKIKADVCENLKILDVGKQETLAQAEEFLKELHSSPLV